MAGSAPTDEIPPRMVWCSDWVRRPVIESASDETAYAEFEKAVETMIRSDDPWCLWARKSDGDTVIVDALNAFGHAFGARSKK